MNISRSDKLQQQGGALHGLRHPVLPHRHADQRHGLGLPDQQPDSGMERSGLSRPLERGAGTAAQDQQFSRVHRSRLPGALRRLVCPRASTSRRSPSRTSSARSSTKASPKAGSRPSRRRNARARKSPSSVPARRDSPARRNSTGPATRSRSSSAPTASADCSCTAFPT